MDDDDCTCGCVQGEACSKVNEFVVVLNSHENVQLVLVEGGITICRNKCKLVEIESGLSFYANHEMETQIIEIGKNSYLIIAILLDYYKNGGEKKIITELFSQDFCENIYYFGVIFTVDDFINYVGGEKINGHTTLLRNFDHINLFIEGEWVAEIDINGLKTLVLTEMPGNHGRVIYGHNSTYMSFQLKHMHPIQNTFYI